jgi:RNA polymerase sigma-70 factor (ECF subfamily)
VALNPSAVVALNRAVVVSKVHGAPAGLAAMAHLSGDAKMEQYHHYHTVRGYLLSELGDKRGAAAAFRAALACRASEPERRLVRRRLAACGVNSEE